MDKDFVRYKRWLTWQPQVPRSYPQIVNLTTMFQYMVKARMMDGLTHALVSPPVWDFIGNEATVKGVTYEIIERADAKLLTIGNFTIWTIIVKP